MSDAVRDPGDAPAHGAAWLIAAARHAEETARARLARAPADLFGADAARLTDYQRATMAQMLDALVAGLEAALRMHAAAGLPPAAAAARAALETARVAIARPLLDRAGALDDAELVALLLRRAEEHRLGQAARLVATDADPIAAFLADADPAIADAAAGLAAAEARRVDRFRGPALVVADLPAELLHRLVWLIAAALRRYLVRTHALAEIDADAAIVPAATTVLAGHDEDGSVAARAAALVRALARAGRLDEDIVRAFAEAGRIAPLVAALASRAQIAQAGAWEMALAPGGDRLALLLRAADIARASAAAILMRVVPDDMPQLARLLDAGDALDPAAARDALRLWRLDPGYREALRALAPGGAGA